MAKKSGKIANLDKLLAEGPLPAATTGLGHTRWATHGGPTDANAHPHLGATGRVALVHNGIIENFAELRAVLEAAGHELVSETDTEVVSHLLEQEVLAGPGTLTEAMQRTCQQLEGAFTLVAVDAEDPSRVVAARRNSPLVVGVGEGENFLGSDVAAFIEYTREALELGQDQVVTITALRASPSRASTVRRPRPRRTTSTGTSRPPRRRATTGSCARRSSSSRAPWPTRCSGAARHRPAAARRDAPLGPGAARHRQDHHHRVRDVVLRRHGGEVRDRALVPDPGRGRAVLGVPLPRPDPRLLHPVVAISQSGETADTLQAIRHARTQRSKVLAICNTNGSTIPRESDAVIYTHAGPEIAVASTKGFMTQLVACYLLALYLAQVKGTRYGDEITQVMTQLEAIPDQLTDRARRPPRSTSSPATTSAPARSCSSAATPATRSPSRARSSSRSSPTCTPRASPPASSSTAPSP